MKDKRTHLMKCVRSTSCFTRGYWIPAFAGMTERRWRKRAKDDTENMMGRALYTQASVRAERIFLFAEIRKIAGGTDHGGVVEVIGQSGNKKSTANLF